MPDASSTESQTRLRSAGLKATKPRRAVLSALADAKRPLGVPELADALGRDAPDTVTLYRVLDDFESAGLVRRVDLRHGHADYELAGDASGGHHHHLVCTSCGLIEDLDACFADGLEAKALRASERFTQIDDHSLEFFGRCRQCS